MHNDLLSEGLAAVLDRLRRGDDPDRCWRDAEHELALARPDDPGLHESDEALAVAARDDAVLAELVAGWRDGTRPLPVADRVVCKRAMKAFRKRLKLTRLDDESKLGGRGMTSGRESGIVAVRPPEQYPAATWAALARLGRLRDEGGGLFSASEPG